MTNTNLKDLPQHSVRELMERFAFRQLVGDDASLDRRIEIPDINRPGLELAGYFEYSQTKRIIILGDKEIEYIKTMDDHAQERSFDFLTEEQTPAIIIAKNHPIPESLRLIATKKNFPVFSTPLPTYQLIIELIMELDDMMAPFDNVHGGLLSIFGKGVLITGESGLGKSEIALELIKRGHLLVADDRVDCYRMHNGIVGKAPELLEGMLEIRGVGIISVARMFGVSSVLKKKSLDLVIALEHWSKNKVYDRIGVGEEQYESILGIEVPKITIPVKEGRSMAAVIEAAVTNFTLKEMGMDSAKEFEQRVFELCSRNNT
ncbi:MAG: HPr(Ser) kinase/phosphatase [Erysipelotrichaceae bacterium]